jgi:hypothetical protein
MTANESDPYFNPDPYIPLTLSEISDQLISMVFSAPTFVDPLGNFPEREINQEFFTLQAGLDRVRSKLGEERYSAAVDLATRAKALFVADQEDTNGKTDEGREMLFQIDDILKDVRRRRVEAKQVDEEGEVSGD